MLTFEQAVAGFREALGEFYHGSHERGARVGDAQTSYELQESQVPVFHQRLPADTFRVAIEPGSHAYAVLTNDQNRFNLPRALPPLLAVRHADQGNEQDPDTWLTRYAYTEGAFVLLEQMLRDNFIFSLEEFLGLATTLCEVLAFLHQHEVVHGQWNPRCVVAIPTTGTTQLYSKNPRYRFEVLNTAVAYRDGRAIPREFLDRGYFPEEILLGAEGVPDYRAMDIPSDVYCCASFLRDLLHRASSGEELTTQAQRIHEQFQREVGRRGLKASPEKLRHKEQEILDHLYTLKACTESMIQEGLHERGSRCDAEQLFDRARDLHQKALLYAKRLLSEGFEPINVFDDDLQHYTSFRIRVEPQRIQRFVDNEVCLEGSDLPSELVRVALNDGDRGVQVLDADASRIRLAIRRGFPTGNYKISINNRRTNGRLEVFAAKFAVTEPLQKHQPWPQFGPIALRFAAADLPEDVHFSLNRSVEDDDPLRIDDPDFEMLTVRRIDSAPRVVAAEGEWQGQLLEVDFAADTDIGEYRLCANGLSTGLRVRVLPMLPQPWIDESRLPDEPLLNHQQQEIDVYGDNFHSDMRVDLGEGSEPLEFVVEGPQRIRLRLPEGLPEGNVTLRLNYESAGELQCVRPTWNRATPDTFKIKRGRSQPVHVALHGAHLPAPREGRAYSLRGANGRLLKEGVARTEVSSAGDQHDIWLPASVPRGRCRVYFGDHDTGVRLRVQRQLQRSTWVMILFSMLAASAGIGADQVRRWRPQIASVGPSELFDLGPARVAIEGRNLDTVLLIDQKSGVPESRVLTPAADRQGYTLDLADLAPGRYQLAEEGWLTHFPYWGSEPSTHTVLVKDTQLTVEPTQWHRWQGVELTVSAAEGFDVREAGLQRLRLQPLKTGIEPFDFALSEPSQLSSAGILVTVDPSTFGVGHEGNYEVFIDGSPVSSNGTPLTLTLTGPEITGLPVDQVTLKETGEVEFELHGHGLISPDGQLPWLGLVNDLGLRHRLQLEVAPDPDEFDEGLTLRAWGWCEPGRYQLAVGRGSEETGDRVFDLFEQWSVDVLPIPRVTEILPTELEPGSNHSLQLAGFNLQALGEVRLVPTAGGEGIVLHLADATVEGAAFEEARVRFEGVSLASGAYRVEPSEDLLIQVFDDCSRILDRWISEGGAADELISCLGTQRPSEKVILTAAQHCFDRGHFDEALVLYDGRDELVARFRTAFLRAFHRGEAWRMRFSGRDGPSAHAVAGRWLGGDTSATLPPGELSWELAFVKGALTDDPVVGVSLLEEAARAKTEASLGHELQPFAPIEVTLRRRRLQLAEDYMRSGRVVSAAEVWTQLLRAEAQQPSLAAADRAQLHFWLGHHALWYSGDLEGATSHWQAGTRGEGDYAQRCQRYLDLHGESTGGGVEGGADNSVDDRADDDRAKKSTPDDARASNTDEWFPTFAELYRFYREISEGPNFNLLTERYDLNVYLSARERQQSVEFHKVLRQMEALEAPQDPLVHYALLYYLRHAQKQAWPQQEGGEREAVHRRRLQDLHQEGLPWQRFYSGWGLLAPLDPTQLAVLPPAQKRVVREQVQGIPIDQLPPPLAERANALLQKIGVGKNRGTE